MFVVPPVHLNISAIVFHFALCDLWSPWDTRKHVKWPQFATHWWFLSQMDRLNKILHFFTARFGWVTCSYLYLLIQGSLKSGKEWFKYGYYDKLLNWQPWTSWHFCIYAECRNVTFFKCIWTDVTRRYYFLLYFIEKEMSMDPDFIWQKGKEKTSV